MNALMIWMLAYALNSLWQVPLVFAAAWLATRIARPSGPAIEHRIWVGALALEAILPAISVPPRDLIRNLWALVSWRFDPAAGAHARITVVPGPGYLHGALGLPAHLLAVAAVVYGCGVAWFALRFVCGLFRAAALWRRANKISPDGIARRIWKRCRCAFNVPDAELAVSSEISGPMTMGIRRQVMLLPAGFETSLPDEDLDTAIAHEFAHIRRRDFAKNLLYEALSLPVAYHPLLWLTRAHVAESREMICDAMAAEVLAGPEKYARSLLRLASMLVQGTPARSLHAIGIFDAHTFERRVMKLTEKHVQLNGMSRLATAAACALIGLGTCASAMALRMDVSMPGPQSESQPGLEAPPSPVRVSGGVMAGQILSKVAPVYPPDARAAGIQGSVVLHAIIGTDGTVQNLQVVSGPDELADSALNAVKQWIYKPFLLNGNPTVVETTITVNYSLAR